MNANTNNTNMPANGSKVYEMVTKRILQRMMQGEIPWRQTFFLTKKDGKNPYRNYITGKPYSLLNAMLLGDPGEYATMKQINDLGGAVAPGSKGKFVVYWGEYIPKENKEEAKRLEEEGKDISHLKVRFPKYYYVFNVKDAVGLPEKKEEAKPQMQAAIAPVDIADLAVKDYTRKEKVKIETDPVLEPAYIASTDTVQTPGKQAFSLEEDYYASLFDALVHSTSTEGRCDRKREYTRLSEDNMSVKEELIGDIGSSMILSVAGMKREETHQQLAADCQRWIAAFQNDYRLVVNASSAAEKAAKMILGEFAE